jgi:hypothetical protein
MMYNLDPGQNQEDFSPEETRLETLFHRFNPHPTERFYRRMASAPWNKAPLPRYTSHLLPWRKLAVASVVILLVFTGLLAFPQISVMARQMLSFFLARSSDQMTVQITIPASGESRDFSSEGYFSLTPEEAGALAGYPVKDLPVGVQDLIPALQFTGAHFDPDIKTITLRYSVGTQNLYLSQHPTKGIEEYEAIGPSALVEQATVSEVQGEFVTGGWKLEHENTTPSGRGTQVSMDIRWDASLPRMTLRWRKDGMLYEIVSSAFIRSDKQFGKEDLIRVAELVH